VTSAFEELLNHTTTCAVADVLMKLGFRAFMSSRIKPLNVCRLAGPALTVERKPIAATKVSRPNSIFIETVESASAGTVLVFNGDAEHEAALWGGLLAAAATHRKLGGIVADGPIRDPMEITEMKQPCFCTGVVAGGQAGILTLGEINRPLNCGGVTVNPGDFMFGDANGVVVIPGGMERDVLERSVEVEKSDQEATKRILAGASFQETMRALGRA